MGVGDILKDFARAQLAGDILDLQEQVRQRDDSLELLSERLAELELGTEDAGYLRLAADGDRDFSRDGLRRITRQARLYRLKNPLILRGVEVKKNFVFGQGISVQARDEAVAEVVTKFWADAKNVAELTSHQALLAKEDDLQVEGNLFFALFTHPATGHVRIRTIPFDEVEDIVYNPEDGKDPWFYKRVAQRSAVNLTTGNYETTQVTTYHPDWRYRPAARPATIGGVAIAWDAPVYHVSVNRLSGMRFGVSEVYAAVDWARAYKEFLEDWATIVKSYARFAWKGKVKGGSSSVAAAKTALGTRLTGSNAAETNPSPATASTWIENQGMDLTPMRTAGATTSAEDGRRLLLMVSAAMGVYEHYFGDPSSGNLATTKTMERPMELMFQSRRKLWADVILAILGYAIDQAAIAPGGALRGVLAENEYGEATVDLGDLDTHIDVDFPPLLEKSIQETVQAIISAATLDGKSPAGLDLKTVTRMLLVALGEDDIDQMIEDLFPEGWEEERAQRAMAMQQALAGQQGGPTTDKEVQADGDVAEALRALSEAVRELREGDRPAA